MTDWLDRLNDDDRREWDAFVERFRHDALQKIDSSAFVMSLVPSSESFDVKFAVELGASIMLDKPLFLVAPEDVRVPDKLAAIADEVVVADVDTEEGRQAIASALREWAENAWEEASQ